MLTSIHHVALATADLDAAARAYSLLFNRAPDGAFAAHGTRQVWFSTSNIRFALIAPDGAGGQGDAARARLAEAGEGLWSICYCVDDLDKAANLFERRGLAPAAEQTLAVAANGGAANVRARRLPVAATHGIEMILAAAPPPVRVQGAADAASGLDHLVIRTADPERTVALYGGRLGLDMRLDRSNPAWGARLLFFRCGDLVVEIAHELKGGVSQKPDWFGGISWRVPDMEATRTRLAGAGRNVSEARRGRRPGSHVCTLRDGTANVPTILLSVES